MKGKNRRSAIVEAIKKAGKPMKGTELSKKYGVSRQVIVQDIALLRAEGKEIIATPQGYIIPEKQGKGRQKTIVTRHNKGTDLKKELTLMVDLGVVIVDVIVEHPVYGEIRGNLNINSRLDIENFMNQLEKQEAKPLAELTDGVHMHTIEVPSEAVYEQLLKVLRKNHYLIEG
ncbi:transcription repressor NadR [Isachenkonia alkalipeptolytica]|uniref:Transcription repressor NadR n=1 Tax=Isachenkonia alkalipeptolytica TaxID=2565777 RepID=A0AA43XM68_9CLOT|nr:transcription repressor NadR [Isachenkonia alkalipeptolytica]NBG89237.1 transcription repressor NadR [Isachenkonia alkalipeptolytica]